MIPVLIAPMVLGAQQAATPQRAVGVVQAVSGSNLVVKSDAGGSVNVRVEPGARVLRAGGSGSPQPAQLSDIETGDRVLAKGTPSADGTLFTATAILLMKSGDVASRQQQELAAWQRGISGVVISTDRTNGDIHVKNGPAANLVVHTKPATQFLRYAPDSIQFKDAQKSDITAIKPGDQLRSKGEKSPDSTSIAADTVVSGTFRNIVAVVRGVDAAANQLTVQDLITKKSVQLKVDAETQAHALPTQMAARIGMMLKGAP
ncbi:MAG: hypothetical protein JOZ43_01530, partial [Acidobacteriales bacterium]|nr:hypothetical protein [Terriglobales bacterium]